MLISYLFLLLSGTCSAGASIALRLAGEVVEGAASRTDVTLLALPLPLLLRFLAVGAYGLGFILYAISLKKIELGIAYPLMVTITLLELFVYNAIVGGVTLRMGFGAILLISGLFLLAPSTSTAVARS